MGTRLSQTAGSAHVIKRKQLERFEYDDPHAVLAAVPGVYSRGEDGIGLRPNIGIRGVNPDRSKKITLLEDGILFAPAPYAAPAAYFFPLITRMTGVRVIKGPAAVSYGPQTVGGAIDLVTRPVPTAPTTGGVDLAAGEYGYAKAHAYFGASDERFGFLVEGVHVRNDGFKRLPGGGDTGSYRNEWMVKGSYVIDPKARVRQELRLKATYSDEVSNESYLGLSDADFAADPRQRYAASALDRMEWHRTAVALTYLVEPAPGLKVTTTAYRNDLARVWRKVNRFRGVDLFAVLRDPNDARNAIYHGVLKGQADSSSPGETLLIGPNDRDFVAQGVESRVRWDTRSGPLTHRLEYGLRL
ncbi:MAG TPA: TonB-dependent receptor plug domain-containing protein, partial [Polyangiaceae bacterium]|nr:TonB-dependent receptor plug domain-containing protein [Polyangiaceae bacterium]